jgi:hypothetical protein
MLGANSLWVKNGRTEAFSEMIACYASGQPQTPVYLQSKADSIGLVHRLRITFSTM